MRGEICYTSSRSMESPTQASPRLISIVRTVASLIFIWMAYLYAAKLSTNPREDVEAACKEFLDRINCGDINLFINPKTAVKLKRELCLCDPNVVALEHIRGVKRAQAILRAGLEQSGR